MLKKFKQQFISAAKQPVEIFLICSLLAIIIISIFTSTNNFTLILFNYFLFILNLHFLSRVIVKKLKHNTRVIINKISQYIAILFLITISFLETFVSQTEVIFLIITISLILFINTKDGFEIANTSRSNNWLNIISYLVLCILVLFFVYIKIPYYDTTLTGNNSMKYNAYVEPALHMMDKNSIFVNQRSYQAKLNNVDNQYLDYRMGEQKYFGEPPLLEWGIYLAKTLFPSLSIEQAVRIYTSFLGILFILSFYVFISSYLSNLISIIAICLLVSNPIINLISFLTVYDTIMFVFIFISLKLFIDFEKEGKSKLLLFSALIGGVAVAEKYTAIIILLPFILTYTLLKNKYNLAFLNIIIFSSLIFLPTIISRTSIRLLPDSLLLAISMLFIQLFFTYFLYKNFNKLHSKLKLYFEKIKSVADFVHKFTFILLFCLLLFGIFLYVTKGLSLLNYFILDFDLLFNVGLYANLFITQLSEYLGPLIYTLFLLSIIIILLHKKYLFFALPLIASVIVYVVVASKVIFFHNYYFVLLILVACLFISLVLVSLFPKNLVSYVALIILSFSFGLSNIQQTNSILSQEKEGIIEAANYIRENSNKDSIFVIRSHEYSISLYSGIPSMTTMDLDSDTEFKKLVQLVGLKEALLQNNINYFIGTPDYERLSSLVNPDISPSIDNRSAKILFKLGQADSEFTDQELRFAQAEIIKGWDIFELEKIIGDYKIYRIK